LSALRGILGFVLETSARLLRLLSLLQSRRFWTGAALAERLEVSERTVRRDVDKVRSLGYPVNASAGIAGGYELGAGSALPPLLLDDDEALAVVLGLRSAVTGGITGSEEAAVRALVKLEQLLPTRLRRRVKALQASIVTLYRPVPRVAADTLTTLASACRNQQQLRFDYLDSRARASQRNVEPHGLVHSGARWYLVAWDCTREDWRTFRLDRVQGKLALGATFRPRPLPDKDLATFVSRSVGTEPYAVRAKVILHAPLEHMAQRISPLTGRLERIDEKSCLLETGGDSAESLALHVAILGVEFEVLEPVELERALRRLYERLGRALAGPDKGLETCDASAPA
jgi:predicted DNA-binding transcriptional regulator YafY